MAYQSAGVGAIQTEDLDRRLGVNALGLCESADGSVGEARSCHAGASDGEATGEHGGGDGVGEWMEGGDALLLAQWQSKLVGRLKSQSGCFRPSSVCQDVHTLQSIQTRQFIEPL